MWQNIPMKSSETSSDETVASSEARATLTRPALLLVDMEDAGGAIRGDGSSAEASGGARAVASQQVSSTSPAVKPGRR
jgi:hypothetical protein